MSLAFSPKFVFRELTEVFYKLIIIINHLSRRVAFPLIDKQCHNNVFMRIRNHWSPFPPQTLRRISIWGFLTLAARGVFHVHQDKIIL